MKNGQFKAIIDGTDFQFSLERGEIRVGGVTVDATIERISDSTYSMLLNGRSYELTVQRNGGGFNVTESGTRYEVKVLDRAAQLLEALQASTGKKKQILEVRAPMPGLVLAIEVQKGDEVTSGQGVIILEAMKMENEIFSSISGSVQEIHVDQGEAVTKGQVLITFEAH